MDFLLLQEYWGSFSLPPFIFLFFCLLLLYETFQVPGSPGLLENAYSKVLVDSFPS